MSQLNPRHSSIPPAAVYLCQPAVDRPGWLERAIGLQLWWAEYWGRGGVATCCQLLVGHDVTTTRPVPLFRYNVAPPGEETARVRREQPRAGLMLQTRIWSASARGDEPWGEIRLSRLRPRPVEICHLVGGGSLARWRRWASMVAREVGVILGAGAHEHEGGQGEASGAGLEMSVPRLSRAGRAALRAYGLAADPVWVGLLDAPKPVPPEGSRPCAPRLEAGIETLYRGPCHMNAATLRLSRHL